MYANFSNQLIPLHASKKECKPDPNHHFSLADTYLALDMRESYLQRQTASLISGQPESTFLTTNDFQTKTCNVWRSDDPDIFPSQEMDFYDGSAFTDKVGFFAIRVNLTLFVL
jgi:hypothetical protein